MLLNKTVPSTAMSTPSKKTRVQAYASMRKHTRTHAHEPSHTNDTRAHIRTQAHNTDDSTVLARRGVLAGTVLSTLLPGLVSQANAADGEIKSVFVAGVWCVSVDLCLLWECCVSVDVSACLCVSLKACFHLIDVLCHLTQVPLDRQDAG